MVLPQRCDALLERFPEVPREASFVRASAFRCPFASLSAFSFPGIQSFLYDLLSLVLSSELLAYSFYYLWFLQAV